MPFEPWKEEQPDNAVQEQEAPPPEPVAEAAPEPAPETPAPAPKAEAAPEPEKRTDDAVPLAKALEWRNQWRDTERKLQDAMERLKALEKPPEPQVQVPRYEDDPVEHLRVKQELAERQIAEFRAREEAQSREMQMAAQRQQFVGWYQQQAQEFGKQQADFNDAYKHTVGRMQAILSSATDNPGEVAQALEAWEAGIVRRAAAEGRNPAQAMYEVAKALGYATPAPAAPAPATDVEKVTNIAEAKERSKSLGPSRSAEPAEAEDDEMGGLKTLFEAQAEMGLRRKK